MLLLYEELNLGPYPHCIGALLLSHIPRADKEQQCPWKARLRRALGGNKCPQGLWLRTWKIPLRRNTCDNIIQGAGGVEADLQPLWATVAQQHQGTLHTPPIPDGSCSLQRYPSVLRTQHSEGRGCEIRSPRSSLASYRASWRPAWDTQDPVSNKIN